MPFVDLSIDEVASNALSQWHLEKICYANSQVSELLGYKTPRTQTINSVSTGRFAELFDVLVDWNQLSTTGDQRKWQRRCKTTATESALAVDGVVARFGLQLSQIPKEDRPGRVVRPRNLTAHDHAFCAVSDEVSLIQRLIVLSRHPKAADVRLT